MKYSQTLKAVLAVLMTLNAVSAIGTNRDNSTYANIDEVAGYHIDLQLQVDFTAKHFIGYVVHSMVTVDDLVTMAYFDLGGEVVTGVQYRSDSSADWGANLTYTITSPKPAIGSALGISLPIQHNKAEKFQLKIDYSTTNEGNSAFSWMTKEQTACGKMEYLYSQCEDIACRSMAPMQDTPANRITYTATITAPAEYDVRMSANRTSVVKNDTFGVFKFDNQITMPTYLMAIAIGDLEYRSLGSRVGVITEPCKIDTVAWELEELPTFVDYAEDYLTPYIWGNYSILILPPSFPMGGMENPLLTFASPTIITGDRSQVDVAIHEIAHSWTGNEVTCENWSNMWINEGFTVFEERKVSARLHDWDFSKVNAYIGNISATNDMVGYGLKSNFSSLYPLLDSGLPDESFSTIPYEKGFQLLYHIETIIGEYYMQGLLREYILANSQQSINYLSFKKHFEDYVARYFPLPMTIYTKMDWDAWVHGTGLAPVWQDLTTPALNESSDLADEYIKMAGSGSPDNFTAYSEFYSGLQVIFLNRLNSRSKEDSSPVTAAVMKQIDGDLDITHTLDPECKMVWFPLGIMLGYAPVVEVAHSFISSMGRMKYLMPIYQALLDSNQKDTAVKWFNENVNFYHPYCVNKLKKMLEITDETIAYWRSEKEALKASQMTFLQE